MTRRRIIGWACRLSLCGIFVAASVPKILAPHDFAVAVFRYQMLPYPLVNLLAIFLPWIELVAALALLTPAYKDAAAFILLGLLVVFTAAIATDLVRGINISCGCFSVSAEAGRIGWLEVLRDLAFMALAVLTWKFPPRLAPAKPRS